MLGWAITFLVVALIAAVFGFSGIAAASAGVAQILFWVLVALFLASLVFGLLSGRSAGTRRHGCDIAGSLRASA
jgi:uncharacterized membrane protein YtjA (UPF0391 family)